MRRDPKNLLTVALMGTTLLLSSAACGSETTNTSSPSSPQGSTSDSVTPPPTDGNQTPPVSGLRKPVTLVVGGGFAGVNDRIEVQPDGSYTVTSKGKTPRQGKLDERQLSTIAGEVDEADLPKLSAQPPVTATVTQSDQFTYALSADGATLKATETTLPPAVKPLINELKSLLSVPAPTP